MIIRVWESPTNEGTECFMVGVKSCGHDWYCGRIEVCDPPVPERHERYNVYDNKGNLRAVLPAAACAYELDGVVE